jgi:hypothetical protein
VEEEDDNEKHVNPSKSRYGFFHHQNNFSCALCMSKESAGSKISVYGRYKYEYEFTTHDITCPRHRQHCIKHLLGPVSNELRHNTDFK